jgi:hypothetical protein
MTVDAVSLRDIATAYMVLWPAPLWHRTHFNHTRSNPAHVERKCRPYPWIVNASDCRAAQNNQSRCTKRREQFKQANQDAPPSGATNFGNGISSSCKEIPDANTSFGKYLPNEEVSQNPKRLLWLGGNISPECRIAAQSGRLQVPPRHVRI